MDLVQVIENYQTVGRRWRLAAGIVLEDPQVVQLLRAKKLGPNFIKGLAALERRARALQKAGHTALNFSLKPKTKADEPEFVGRTILPGTPDELVLDRRPDPTRVPDAAETIIDRPTEKKPSPFPPEDLSKQPGMQELLERLKSEGKLAEGWKPSSPPKGWK